MQRARLGCRIEGQPYTAGSPHRDLAVLSRPSWWPVWA